MASNNVARFEFTTPVGRLVSGDAFEPQTKDSQGRPLVDRKTGQPTQKWFMGVAFAKDNPEFQAWYQQLWAQAMRDWPHLFDAASGQCLARNFSWKVIDGDGHDDSGRAWSEREGYAGHFVVRFQSQYAPAVFQKGQYDPMSRITDPSALKRGYFVRVAGSAQGNSNNEKPGMYMNPSMVEIFGYGPIIQGGPDAGAAFGNQQAPAYIPQGMTAAPMAGAMPGMSAPAAAMPGMSAPAAAMPGMSAPAAAMPGMPAPAAAMPGMPAPAAAMPGMPAPAPIPVVPDANFSAGARVQMGPNAQGFTYDQWKAQGYNDDQLRASGVIV